MCWGLWSDGWVHTTWRGPGRGLHSFPFPHKLSLLCPFPLNLSPI